MCGRRTSRRPQHAGQRRYVGLASRRPLVGRRAARDPLAGLAGIVIAPLAATLIQMAISRGREFVADEGAARATGQPLALASALRKIEIASSRIPMDSATPATSHLFIQNPLAGGGLLRLFSTHPPTEDRIERLHAMANHRHPVAA